MRKGYLSVFIFLLTGLCVTVTTAAETMEQADALYQQGERQSYRQAIGIYEALLNTTPDDFELNWKCARAYREFAETAKKNQIDGWKKICAEYGKKGMQYASSARARKPDHPAGYYFYGLNVGIYSDGTSILTALKEGLKDKTQKSFEKAYELDKMYEDAGSILALGRFWAVLPWPLTNKKKSLAYYREYQQTPFFQQRDEGKVYLAELLISLGGKANKAEAKQILQQAILTDDIYFSNWARRLMEKIK